MSRGPRKQGVYIQRPTPGSVQFNGRCINLLAIERETGINNGNLSKVFRKHRAPSLDVAIKLADVLEITVDEFLRALAAHQPKRREVA